MPALMLHCALGRARDWRALLAAMRTPLAAQGFDMPGHGRSDDWDGTGEFQGQCVAHAQTLLQAPSLLIGHSFGATIALRLALERPDLVRALVLIEPVLFAAARSRPEYAAHAAHDAEFASAIALGDYHTAAALFLDLWGTGTPFREMPPAEQDRISAKIPLIMATTPAIYDDSAGILAPGRLEGLRAPVLLLHGSASPPVAGAINAALCERLPDAQAQCISGAGHMLPLTHPATTADAIDGFLTQMSG
ncbi:alpha/beta hydrolase [Roseinatronobacter sp. HJB301]|uniref:Alpha/beta hydrolase n=2 Tax=Roseinatronobacter alkalisoli TaxID=3028235 RepID=A0ABT5TDG4_9RHOB|nr:alpha/beta hydrolase [Roseinatronobacter sp. HJB301]